MKKTFLLLILVSAAMAFPSLAFAQTQTRARTVDQVNNAPDPAARLREEIEVAPNDAERNHLRLKLAEVLLATGQKPEAIAELKKVNASNSFDPIGFYNLGNAYARLGDTDAAIAAYRTAIEQRNGRYSRAYNNLGVLLLRTGKWEEAQEALLSALKLESFRYAEASYNLGRVYAAKGQNDLAAREWRRALAVDPKHDAAAQALSREGRNETIVVASTPAVKGSASPVVKGSASPAVKGSAPPLVKGSAPSAVASRTLKLDQASYDDLQRARSASERGKKSEAADIYRHLLGRNNGYFPPANLELSFVLLSLNRNDEALSNLLEVTNRDGARYPIGYYHLARLYETKGELKLAEAAFQNAISTYTPANPQFLLDLSRVREKLGDFKGSLEAMESFLKIMQEKGQKPSWTDERIAELRSKATKQN
jgi:tetratricopeptide (TPR) repeat protein